MKEVEGYVCVGRNPGVDILYGKGVEYEEQSFQSLGSNGLKPFTTSEEATDSREEILEKMLSFSEVKTGKIKLEILDDPRELKLFEDEGQFIALMERYKGDFLMIGASEGGRGNLYPLVGSSLERNGLKPFSRLEDAVEAARESARQTGAYSTIAKFSYEELEHP